MKYIQYALSFFFCFLSQDKGEFANIRSTTLTYTGWWVVGNKAFKSKEGRKARRRTGRVRRPAKWVSEWVGAWVSVRERFLFIDFLSNPTEYCPLNLVSSRFVRLTEIAYKENWTHACMHKRTRLHTHACRTRTYYEWCIRSRIHTSRFFFDSSRYCHPSTKKYLFYRASDRKLVLPLYNIRENMN